MSPMCAVQTSLSNFLQLPDLHSAVLVEQISLLLRLWRSRSQTSAHRPTFFLSSSKEIPEQRLITGHDYSFHILSNSQIILSLDAT
jgi:hypothetical protein